MKTLLPLRLRFQRVLKGRRTPTPWDMRHDRRVKASFVDRPALCCSCQHVAASTVAAELARQRGEDLWLVFVMPSNTSRALGDQVLSAADDNVDLLVVAQGVFEASDRPVLLARPPEPR